MKVLVHQGFHKTGTTTLQRTLHRSRQGLTGQLNILLPQDLMNAGFSARRYAVAPKPRTLRNFGLKFQAALEPLRSDTDRPFLISNEEFAGLIPGRKDVWAYEQTPVLARALIGEIQKFAGGAAQITFLFTTRDATEWMRSVYWQNLRAHRICEDFAHYSRALEPGADLDSVVEKVRSAVGQDARVISMNVSRLTDRFAPMRAAFDALGVQPTGLTLMEEQNKQPDDAAELFLELHRSDLSD